jgi:hypothetical protein
MDPSAECMIVPLCSRARNTTLRSILAQRAFVNRLVRTRMLGGVGAGGYTPGYPIRPFLSVLANRSLDTRHAVSINVIAIPKGISLKRTFYLKSKLLIKFDGRFVICIHRQF